MNVTDYTYLINNPDSVGEKQTVTLGNVLDEFPYFQSARALRLKGLYNENSFRYNYALKVTAAHTTDRTVLFDFITSDNFVAIHHALYDKKALELLDIIVVDSEIIGEPKKMEPKSNTLEQSILTSIKEASPIVTAVIENQVPKSPEEKEIKIVEEKLDIGKPLDFSKNEKHSFQEWLQISRTQPIKRETNQDQPTNEPILLPIDEDKKKKAKLIDKFIETSPKIPQVKHGVVPIVNLEVNKEDNSSLMTETLARVYLEQKKYQKAIQAYEILILKYPEKSSFFANRISDIKILQNNN